MSFQKIIALTAIALAAPIWLASCGGDDSSDGRAGGQGAADRSVGSQSGGGAGDAADPQPSIETIVVRDGAPVGGPAELEFDAGEQVRFRVHSDAADEVHVHGYDVEKELPAGRAATLAFPADLEGIFEVELHHSGELIAELQINP